MILEGVDRKELEALAEAGALVTISASQLLAAIVRFEQLEEKVARWRAIAATAVNLRPLTGTIPTNRRNPEAKGQAKAQASEGQKGAQERHSSRWPIPIMLRITNSTGAGENATIVRESAGGRKHWL
ncbi:MAG: hypothetical protein R3F19_14150 [Verrucomicrobiales bacterium]